MARTVRGYFMSKCAFFQSLVLKASRWLAAVAVTGLLATGAQAQLGQILDGTNLMPGDIELATAAAEGVYTQSNVTVGDAATWKNPATGATGKVEVTAVDAAAACVSFRHVATPFGYPERRFDMKRCRGAENNWVMVPD
jgi:hypothetical protein